MRATARILGVVLSAVVLSGCQADQERPSEAGPQDVAAFEEQMATYVESREAISEFDVSNDDGVVVTVSFGEAVTDSDITREVAALTDHEVDAQVPYGLQVQVPAMAGDGGATTAAFFVDVPDPARDSTATRNDLLRRLGDARGIVTLAMGPTTMTAEASGTQLESSVDPASLAHTACGNPDLKETGLTDLTITGPSVQSGYGSLTMRGEQDCDRTNGIRLLVANAGIESPLATFAAAYDEQVEAMVVTITYAGEAPGTPLAQQLADTLELKLEISS